MRCRGLSGSLLITMVLVLLGSAVFVNAATYQSYVFDAWGRAVPTPAPYEPIRTIYGNDLGVGEMRNPADLFTAPDGTLYIVDTRNNRIIRTESDYTVLNIYQNFERDGMSDAFNNPQGVFVTDAGHMFVADTNNGRIVRFDQQGDYVTSISSPETSNPDAFSEYFQFRPRKIAVDRVHRLYVIASGVYDGILELDLDGNFRTFLGAPRVSPTPWDLFWSRFATDEQRQSMTLFIPTELSNLDLDRRGFIYTTVSGGDVDVEQVIRRLNPSGDEILRRDGFHPPMGDINVGDFATDSEITGNSLFVDILSRENGSYSVLDQRRGRVFTYDDHGNLLYIFGGLGQEDGVFTYPVALEQNGDHLLVLDGRSNSITVFAPTRYATLIHEAIDQYNLGQYDAAAHPDYSNQLIKSINDYKRIVPINPQKTDRMSQHIRLCDKLVKAKAREKPVIAFVFAPLGVLSMLRGPQNMFMDIFDDPDEIHMALKAITQTLIDYCTALLETGVHGIMLDTLYASQSIMSKQMWDDLEGPYVEELGNHIRAHGGMLMIHNCGNKPYFDVQIQRMQPNAISFLHLPDDCQSYQELKEKYGHQITLIGCVSPSFIMSATPEEVEFECKQEIDQLKSGGGFILATGCEYPANSSDANARVMVKTAQTYGRY